MLLPQTMPALAAAPALNDNEAKLAGPHRPGRWLTGMTKAEAEELLDYMEAVGRPALGVAWSEEEGFAVRCS
jgi:hypothetical protein